MFVSYAQNYEDVYLWRLFGDREKGSYVDVGAYSPDVHSVTKVFYDRGWSGINIEPVPELFSDLVERRSRDINLPIALGSEARRVEFFSIPDSGLSTVVGTNAEAAHTRHGFEVRSFEIECRTLDDVWAEHLGSRRVEFLKIDVEGYELEVLQGAAKVLTDALAEVIIIEAIDPGTKSPCHERFEPLLTASGYTCALFDGVNRWYLAPGATHWAGTLEIPVNLFDGAVPVRLAQEQQQRILLETELRTLREQSVRLIDQTRDCQSRLIKSENLVDELRTEIESVYSSHTWRLTGPARRTLDALRRLMRVGR